MKMNGFSPLTKMKIMPKFKSSASLPQQRLRREEPLFLVDDGAYGTEEDIELFLGSLKGLEDDYGSYAPIGENAPVASSSNVDMNIVLDSSSESDASGSTEAILKPEKKPRELKPTPHEFHVLTEALAKRIETSNGSGRSGAFKLVTPNFTPRNETSFADSSSCTSDAETEVWSNLTNRLVGTKVSSGNLDEIEAWNVLASTFVGREESLENDRDSEDVNSLCEDDLDVLSEQSDDESEAEEPKVLVNTTAQSEEEIEIIVGTSSRMDSLSLSSHSSISSGSSNSSGILRPPKRAIGFDPFGENTDFSLPVPQQPQRRVHFSNLDELKVERPMNRRMRSDASSIASDWSDSTTSMEYLMNYMSCGVQDIVADEV
ncbi:hypothetical protein ACHAWF_011917 [Thalassiosira exigua]